MIHTFTLKWQINAEEYWNFKNTSQTKSYKMREYKLENSILEEMGIILYARKYKVPKRNDYFCYEMFVNPTKVLGRERVVDIYKPEMFNDFMEQFNHIIQSYEVQLPPLEQWTAKRIDFTKDIKTEYVKEYIKLFQKSNLKGYKFPKDKNNHNVRFRKGSLYCRIKNHAINFYDKQDELINQNLLGKRFYDDDELEQAKNVLRIEVQCSKSKLHGIKNKHHLISRNIIPFLQREDIADEIITYYVKKLLGTADYYKKPSAINRIKKSSYSSKTKQNMINFIEDVAVQYSSIDKVLEEHKEYKPLLKKFDELSISPVTINKNNKDISVMLPSIYKLI